MAQIMVQLQNGQEGTMDDSEFNPATMKQLGGAPNIQSPSSPATTTPQNPGMGMSAETLRQRAMAAVAADPKHASEYISQYNAFKPSDSQIKENTLLTQLHKDVQGGGKFSDIGPNYSKSGIDPNIVRAAYNAGPTAAKYGPATETAADLAALASGKPTTAQAASQKKNEAYGSAKSNIQTILDSFLSLPGYDKGGPIQGLTSNIPISKSNTYNKQTAGLAAQLGPLAGAGSGTGLRINNYELARWQALLPSPGNTPEQNAMNVGLLDSELKNKFGQGLDPAYLKQFNVKPTKIPPTENNGDQTGNPLTDALNGNPVTKFLLDKATNVAQDTGAGINARIAAPGIQKNAAAADALEQQAVAARDAGQWDKIGPLLTQANALRTGNSQEAGGISKAFSPDVKENPITRGALAGNQIAGAAGLANMATKIPSILSGAGDAGNAILSRITGGAAGAAPTAEATTEGAQPNFVKSLLQNLTKTGVNQKITDAAAKGGDINYENIADAARKAVANKGTVVKTELEKLIAENRPLPVDGSPPVDGGASITSPQALELRQGLGSRLPSNFFENGLSKFLGGNNSSERNMAIDALRRSASDALKTAAPGTVGPSKLYSIYASHGDPAGLAARAAIGIGANKLGKVIPGIGNPTLDALPLLSKLFGIL